MLFGNLQIIKRDGSDGSQFPITSDTLIGSDQNVCDVKIKADGVAGQQCRIRPCPQSKKILIEVLDDSCGQTQLNGVTLPAGEKREVTNADMLTISDRKFRLFYPAQQVKQEATKTPGSAVKVKRRSIFNRTPPNLEAPLTPSRKQPDQTDAQSGIAMEPSTPSVDLRTTPKMSPRPRKSILSAKKNLLVTRTPTMSPKIVTWGNNRYKSPDKSPSPKKSRHTIGGSSSLAMAVALKKGNKQVGQALNESKGSAMASPVGKSRSSIVSNGTPSRRRSTGVIYNAPNHNSISSGQSAGTPVGSKLSAEAFSKSPALVPKSPGTAHKSPALLSKSAADSASPAVVATSSAIFPKSPAVDAELSFVASASPVVTVQVAANASHATPPSTSRTEVVATPSAATVVIEESPFSLDKLTGAMQGDKSILETPVQSETVRECKASTANKRSSEIPQTPASLNLSCLSRKSSGSDVASGTGRKMRLSQSFAIGDDLTSTAVASPVGVGGNLSIVTQPSDSFGSLSVSDVDMSLFEGSMVDESTVNATMRSRRSSSGSSLNGSTSCGKTRSISRSPKTPVLVEEKEDDVHDDEMAETSKHPDEQLVGSPDTSALRRTSSLWSDSGEFASGKAAADPPNHAAVATSSTQEPDQTLAPKTGRSSKGRSPKSQSARKSLRHSANFPVAEVNDHNPTEDCAKVNQPGEDEGGTKKNTFLEKKTWAGVLKKSIASGSPFKVLRKKSLGRNVSVLSKVTIKNKKRQSKLPLEIVAAAMSTGHALSPETIFVCKKTNKVMGSGRLVGTPLGRSSRSSLVDKTLDIDPEMFVSPLKTPDNSDAMSRASAFISKLRMPQKSPKADYSNVSGLKNLMSPIVRRSPRNSTEGAANITPLEESFNKVLIPQSANEHADIEATPLQKPRQSQIDAKTSPTEAKLAEVAPGVIVEMVSEPESQTSRKDRENIEATCKPKHSRRSSRYGSDAQTESGNLERIERSMATPLASKNLEGGSDHRRSRSNNLRDDPVDDAGSLSTKQPELSPSRASASPEGDAGSLSTKQPELSPSRASASPEDHIGIKKLRATPSKSPRESLSGVVDVKTVEATPSAPKSPANNLNRTFNGLEQLVSTSTEVKSPKDGLDVSLVGADGSVKTLPKEKSPLNNLDRTFTGVRGLMMTPTEPKSPKNSLDVSLKGVKHLVKTPNDVKSPVNNLDRSFRGVKRMLKEVDQRPVKSPVNDLDRSFKGVKHMFNEMDKESPKSPVNDLNRSLKGVKHLFDEVRPAVASPENNLDRTFGGVKAIMTTPTEPKSPKNNLDISLRGVKQLLTTPATDIKGPANNLDRSFKGVRRMFRSPADHAAGLSDSDEEGVGASMVSPTPGVSKKRLSAPPEAADPKRRKSSEVIPCEDDAKRVNRGRRADDSKEKDTANMSAPGRSQEDDSGKSENNEPTMRPLRGRRRAVNEEISKPNVEPNDQEEPQRVVKKEVDRSVKEDEAETETNRSNTRQKKNTVDADIVETAGKADKAEPLPQTSSKTRRGRRGEEKEPSTVTEQTRGLNRRRGKKLEAEATQQPELSMDAVSVISITSTSTSQLSADHNVSLGSQTEEVPNASKVKDDKVDPSSAAVSSAARKTTRSRRAQKQQKSDEAHDDLGYPSIRTTTDDNAMRSSRKRHEPTSVSRNELDVVGASTESEDTPSNEDIEGASIRSTGRRGRKDTSNSAAKTQKSQKKKEAVHFEELNSSESSEKDLDQPQRSRRRKAAPVVAKGEDRQAEAPSTDMHGDAPAKDAVTTETPRGRGRGRNAAVTPGKQAVSDRPKRKAAEQRQDETVEDLNEESSVAERTETTTRRGRKVAVTPAPAEPRTMNDDELPTTRGGRLRKTPGRGTTSRAADKSALAAENVENEENVEQETNKQDEQARKPSRTAAGRSKPAAADNEANNNEEVTKKATAASKPSRSGRGRKNPAPAVRNEPNEGEAEEEEDSKIDQDANNEADQGDTTATKKTRGRAKTEQASKVDNAAEATRAGTKRASEDTPRKPPASKRRAAKNGNDGKADESSSTRTTRLRQR